MASGPRIWLVGRVWVGDDRIVYAVDDAERLVLVARIARRREVCRLPRSSREQMNAALSAPGSDPNFGSAASRMIFPLNVPVNVLRSAIVLPV